MHYACIKSTWYLPSMSRILYSIQLEYLAFRSCVLCVYAHCNQAWLIIKFVLLLAKQVFSSLDSFIPLLFYTHTLALTLPHSHSTKFYYLFRELGVSILNSILFKYPWFNEWVPTFFVVECVCVFFLVLVLQTVFAFDMKLRLDSIWFFRLLLFLSVFLSARV